MAHGRVAPLDKVPDGKFGRDPQDQRELDGREHGRDKFLDNFPPVPLLPGDFRSVHKLQPQLPLYKLRLHRTLQHRARVWPQVWTQLVSSCQRGGLVETGLRGGFKTMLGD